MKKTVFVLLALVALALCAWPVVAFAADFKSAALAPIPSISPADFPAPATVMLQTAAPEAHWVWTLVGSSFFATLIGALTRLIQSVINNIKDARIRQACGFVYAGTMTCYQEYVRVVKEKHADGKLTIEEKNEALQYAYRKAVEYARVKGIDLLKVLGKGLILAKIEEYVGSAKAVGAAAKAVALPLPDLGRSAPSV